MKTPLKIAIILVVAGLVAGAVALKKNNNPTMSAPAPVAAVQPSGASTAPQRLPKLLDLGATKCIPCKKMAPILEELKKEYAGKMEVEFIDVWQNPDVGNKYGIRLIPTQIFYDATGKELFRHEGFFGKEDILGKWKALGLDL
jgi:thioredoxin 1